MNGATQTSPTDGVALADPPVLRRRPVFLVAGLLCLAIGALLSAWLFTRLGDSRPVLAVRQDVARGEVITAADLMTVSITADPALQLVPAALRAEVVGQRATSDLPAGGLLVAGSFAAGSIPEAGQSLVGLWLAPGQLPGVTLRAGDRVRAVNTPRSQDDVPAAAPTVLPAVVVAVAGTSSDGHTLVTVSLPAAGAPRLSAMAATTRISLVVDSAAR